MTELEAQQKARDIYLDWTGIPKPRDSYPVGDHAQKLINAFAHALEAAGPRVELNEDPIDGLCSDMFRPPAPKPVEVSYEEITDAYDEWANQDFRIRIIKPLDAWKNAAKWMRDKLAQPQSNGDNNI